MSSSLCIVIHNLDVLKVILKQFFFLQKWLEYYGPFEAVIDAANVGLFSQRKFTPAKVSYQGTTIVIV